MMYRIIGSRGIGKTDALMHKTEYLLNQNDEVTVAFFCAQPDVIRHLYKNAGYTHAERIIFARFSDFFCIKADYKIIDELDSFLKTHKIWAYSDTIEIHGEEPAIFEK